MQQAGDPVFATALCRELVLPANLDLCLRVISILNHSKVSPPAAPTLTAP